MHRQLTDKSRASKSAEELRARLADMQEALGTKDTQLAILKVRLEEINQELGSSRRSVDQLQAENQRQVVDLWFHSFITELRYHRCIIYDP